MNPVLQLAHVPKPPLFSYFGPAAVWPPPADSPAQPRPCRSDQSTRRSLRRRWPVCAHVHRVARSRKCCGSS